MVRSTKVVEPPSTLGYEGEFVRIRNWNSPGFKVTPPPRGAQPVFGSNFLSGYQWLDSSPDCTIVAGRIDCSRNKFPYFQIPTFEIVRDKCNLGITLSLGGIAPTNHRWSFFYRNPECRLEDPPPEDEEYQEPPVDECQNFNARAVYIWWLVDSEEYEDFSLIHHPRGGAYSQYKTTSEIKEVTFPDDEYIGNKIVYARVKYSITYVWNATEEIQELYGWDLDNGETETETFDEEVIIFAGDRYKNLGYGNIVSAGVAYSSYFEFIRDFENFNRATFRRTIPYSRYVYPYDNVVIVTADETPIAGYIETPYRTMTSSFEQETSDSLGYRYFIYRTNIKEAIIVESETWEPMRFCEGEPPDPPREKPGRKPPPPPPPPMRCCPDYSGLLKLILKTVEENKEAIGADDLPASLPASFIVENGVEAGQVEKPNLVQILGWYFERFDEIMGQFEIPIVIEDSDPLTEGNQKQEVKLANISECLGEIMMLLLNNAYNSDLSLNLLTRNLVESGQSKQATHVNYEAIQTIIDYLGYSTKTVTQKLPLSFSPGKDNFEELIKESQIDVPTMELNDKRTLPTIFQELLHAAAIIRSVYWRKLDLGRDFKDQIKENIAKQGSFIDKSSEDE